MLNNIRTMMLQSGFSEDTLPEQAIIGTVQDNLDVACNIIKTAAQEKAVKDIDVNLTPAYAARRKHREVSSSVLSSEMSIVLNLTLDRPDKSLWIRLRSAT